MLRKFASTGLAVCLVWTSFAFGDTDSTAPAALSTSVKRFSLATTLSRSNSLYNRQDGSEQASWDLSISPSYKITKDISLFAVVDGSQDIKAEEADFGRGVLGLRKKNISIFNERTNLSPSISLGFPVSKAAKAGSLQSTLSAGLRIDSAPGSLIWKRFSLGGALGLTRNFHQYDTAISGRVNTQYSSNQSIDMSWAFSDTFSLSISALHYDTLSYQGTHNDYYSHSQELGISLSEKASFAVGHQYGSPFVSTLKSNGQDLNITLMDETNSFIYGQVTLTY
ncbi:MAG: hypothetical protein BroJett040_21990 [Oligoflexia bacterium]|nr:MAG: hypothetical protein BroJett040_21990 [Oligoflexia bacterium]